MEKTNSVTLDNTENAVSRREGERNKKHSPSCEWAQGELRYCKLQGSIKIVLNGLQSRSDYCELG